MSQLTLLKDYEVAWIQQLRKDVRASPIQYELEQIDKQKVPREVNQSNLIQKSSDAGKSQ